MKAYFIDGAVQKNGRRGIESDFLKNKLTLARGGATDDSYVIFCCPRSRIIYAGWRMYVVSSWYLSINAPLALRTLSKSAENRISELLMTAGEHV